MKLFFCVLAILIFMPFSILAQDRQGAVSQSDADKYSSFLREQRSGDKTDTGNFQDYRDDRNTKVRKLSESIQYHEKEARVAKEQAKDERLREKEDLKLSKEKKISELVDKGASAKTDKEADRYYKGAKQLKDSTVKSKKSVDVSIK